MAAEVVELEEKALKARSAELKGEREAAAEREAARRAQLAAMAAQQERETLQSILDTLEVSTTSAKYRDFIASYILDGGLERQHVCPSAPCNEGLHYIGGVC